MTARACANASSGVTTAQPAATAATQHDVIVFRPDIRDTIAAGHTVTIAVSTALQGDLIRDFLMRALPVCGGRTAVIDVTIAAEPANGDARITSIEHMPRDCKALWMVLPLAACPPHETNGMRATTITTRHFPDGLTFTARRQPDGSVHRSVEWPQKKNIAVTGAVWDGAAIRGNTSGTDRLDVDARRVTASHLFVTHTRAVDDTIADMLRDKCLWTSGTHSWFGLAARGLWVQGCTDELGHAMLAGLLPDLAHTGTPAFADWQVLTHDGTENDWNQGQIIATYTVRNGFDSAAAAALKTARHVFWSSVSQYHTYKDYAAADSQHYCRAGRTADVLKSFSVTPLTVLPNMEAWRRCLTQQP